MLARPSLVLVRVGGFERKPDELRECVRGDLGDLGDWRALSRKGPAMMRAESKSGNISGPKV